jgi:hypothetical protein
LVHPPEGSQIDWKRLRQMIFRPDTEQAFLCLESAEMSQRNRKRISCITKEFCTALLKDIALKNGTEVLWKKEDICTSPPYRRRGIACGAYPVTSRDRLIFPIDFTLDQVVEIRVCSEETRDGKDYAVVDGLEFHGEDGMIGYLGRRHQISTTGNLKYSYFENGDTSAGSAAALSLEGFVALKVIKKGRSRTDEAELVRYLESYVDWVEDVPNTVSREEIVQTLPISSIPRLHSIEATFLGASLYLQGRVDLIIFYRIGSRL